MTPKTIHELASIVLFDAEVGSLEITDRIAIVQRSKSGDMLQIVRVQGMPDDDTVVGKAIKEMVQFTTSAKVVKKMILQKQGIFVGTVRLLQHSTVRDAINFPVAVRIKTTGTEPCKDLEKAVSDPSVGADWTSYVSNLDDHENLPVEMSALIIKWRPTKKKTRRALKLTGRALGRAGILFGIHFLLLDDDPSCITAM